MVEAAVASEHSQHRLQPVEAREFAEWTEAPRRSFLRKLIVKLLIAAAALFPLYWAAAALVHYEAIEIACGCG